MNIPKIQNILEKHGLIRKLKEYHNKLHLLGKEILERVQKEGVTRDNQDWYYEKLVELEKYSTLLFNEFNVLTEKVSKNANDLDILLKESKVVVETK